MFVGHYAGAFLARASDRRLPLGAAFLAVQFVDLWWDAFILAGVERARLVPGLPSNPLDLYFMPYSHSLVATVAWAALVFVVVKATKLFGGTTRVALAAAGAVASHWLFDLLVHRADLPVAGDDSVKLGLGLWSQPVLALAVELGVLALAAAVYVRRTGERARWIGGFVAALSVVQVATVVGPLPPTIPAMTASLFVAYLLLAWVASWVQRRAA
jgi:hypothetical protein